MVNVNLGGLSLAEDVEEGLSLQAKGEAVVFCFVCGCLGHTELKCEVLFGMENHGGSRGWSAEFRPELRWLAIGGGGRWLWLKDGKEMKQNPKQVEVVTSGSHANNNSTWPTIFNSNVVVGNVDIHVERGNIVGNPGDMITHIMHEGRDVINGTKYHGISISSDGGAYSTLTTNIDFQVWTARFQEKRREGVRSIFYWQTLVPRPARNLEYYQLELSRSG